MWYSTRYTIIISQTNRGSKFLEELKSLLKSCISDVASNPFSLKPLWCKFHSYVMLKLSWKSWSHIVAIKHLIVIYSCDNWKNIFFMGVSRRSFRAIPLTYEKEFKWHSPQSLCQMIYSCKIHRVIKHCPKMI